MGNVFLNMTISLDGFVAGPNVEVARPMGEDGERLNNWLRRGATEVDREVGREMFAAPGAFVMGRRTFDVGVGREIESPFATHLHFCIIRK